MQRHEGLECARGARGESRGRERAEVGGEVRASTASLKAVDTGPSPRLARMALFDAMVRSRASSYALMRSDMRGFLRSANPRKL